MFFMKAKKNQYKRKLMSRLPRSAHCTYLGSTFVAKGGRIRKCVRNTAVHHRIPIINLGYADDEQGGI